MGYARILYFDLYSKTFWILKVTREKALHFGYLQSHHHRGQRLPGVAVNVAFLQSHKQDLSWLDSTDKSHKKCGCWLCILKIFLEYSDWDGLRKELWRQLSSSFSDNTQVSWKTHSVDHYFYSLPQSCGLVEEKVHIQQLFLFLLFFPFLVFVFNLRGVNTGYLTYRWYFHH